MKYGFYVFNNLKATTGLAIFNNEEDAIDSYRKLDMLWNDKEYCKDFTDDDWEIEYYFSMINMIGYEEDTGRDLENDDDIIEDFRYYMNDDGFVIDAIDDIKLVSCMKVYVPA